MEPASPRAPYGDGTRPSPGPNNVLAQPYRYMAPGGYEMNWPMEQGVYFLGLLAISGMLVAFNSLFAHCGWCAWRDRLSMKKGR
jgi:hypothetical protein